MKTAFVTGGAGFLGLNLVEQLINDNWDVTVFDLNTSGAEHFQEKGVKLVEGNITDLNSCSTAMPKDIDAVFHLAGDTTHWKAGDSRQTKINVGGTRVMVETALNKKARRFIFTSSIGSYGAHPERITEDTPSNATTSTINYWRTKWAAEKEIRKGISQGLDAVILNPANIIGKYDFSGWSRLFLMIDKGKLAGSPPGAASFCHAREVARAHIAAFEKGRTGHNYLLGGTDATWFEFVDKIGSLLNKKVPKKPTPAVLLKMLGQISYWISCLTRKEPDVTPEKAYLISIRLICSHEKAQNELDYKVRSLNEMLTDCHRWLVKEKLI